MRILVLLTHSFLIGTVVFVLGSRVQADDWPTWRGIHRDGVSRESDWQTNWPASGPKIRWKSNIGTGFSSIVVSKGKAYSLGNQDDTDTLFCLNVENGHILWRHDYPSPLDDNNFDGGPTSTPTVDDDRVYILSRAGDLVCLESESGEVQWAKNLPTEAGVEVPGWGFASSPVVINSHLLLNVGQSGMKLDKMTGDVLWQSDGESSYMTPLAIEVDGKSILIVASGKFYQGIDLETGEQLWKQRWLTNFGCNAADPIFHEGKLFISSGYNRGSALLDITSDSPKVLWETKEFQNQWSSSVLLKDHLYGVDGNDTGDRHFKCLDIRTGEVRWSAFGLGSASVISAAGKLIVLSDQGEIVIAEASSESFQPIARASILNGKCWTMPILSNGHLFARNAAGDVVCVDLR
jgi:outer membrane protein assembly factor BamB